MREVMTKSMARDIFYGGSLFFIVIFVGLTVHSHLYIVNRSTAAVPLTALVWGLDACGDETAIRSFSSLRRNRVYLGEAKEFVEPMGPAVAARIAGLRPGFYTRLGAAIRHVAAELARRPRQRRLLLVVTDGKPNDLDHYEGRHGVEDSRMAVREARRMGHAVHGVIIAHPGEGWSRASSAAAASRSCRTRSG